jgi:hypothetical protein
VLALAQRHVPRVTAIQEELHAALVAAGREDDLAGLVEVLVRPTAEYLRRGPSERAWVKISAERFARPEVGLADLADHAHPVGVEVGTRVLERIARDLDVDADVALERLLSVLVATHHLCADRARLEDTPPAAVARRRLPFDRWLANLLDMAVGALSAPPAFGTGGSRAAPAPAPRLLASPP